MTIQRPETPTSPRVDYPEYDERQPLLGASDTHSDTTPADGTPLDGTDKQRNWKRTAVKGVFVFLGATISVGLIVKGFLDANVEVCVLTLVHCVTRHCLRSTSA
jgi:hypothetical protein